MDLELTSDVQKSFQVELLEAVPHLRAFARSLTRNRDEADDLVHDAIARALTAQHQFAVGTNFRAWIFTILRNLFYNEKRKKQRKFIPIDALVTDEPSIAASQEDNLIAADFRRAFYRLTPQYREALTLIGAGGLSYEDAAKICNCQIGTIKSRVFRARAQLMTLLNKDITSENVDRIASDKKRVSFKKADAL